MSNALPPSETWYSWKELVKFDDEEHARLVTPWGDPMQYEYAADCIFKTIEEAEEWKREYAPDESWYLVLETLSPVRFYQAKHIHQWGPVEYARFTGNPHRKCQIPGCKELTMDLDLEDQD